MKQLFVIVQRNLEGKVHIETTSDFMTALCKQKALIVGAPEDIIRATLKQEEIDNVIQRLNTHYQDRLCNDEEEVTIFFMPERDKIR